MKFSIVLEVLVKDIKCEIEEVLFFNIKQRCINLGKLGELSKEHRI